MVDAITGCAQCAIPPTETFEHHSVDKSMADHDVASRGPSVLIVTIIFLVLATIFVTLRMISRIWLVKKVNADDYVMLFAWVYRCTLQLQSLKH